MSVKITALELYDFKKVRAFQCEPATVGLTTIGGKSRQGKTSIPDGVAWCLGGDRHKPEKPQRDGASKPPSLTVTLDNGLVVTRSGKRGSLKVVDPGKQMGNQTLLSGFVSQWALDAPKFLRSSAKEKAAALLGIIGVGDELKRLDKLHDDLYAEREAHGRVTIQKEKYAAELPLHKDTPEKETSASALIEEIRNVDADNAENAEHRRHLASVEEAHTERVNDIAKLEKQFADDDAGQRGIIAQIESDLVIAREYLAKMAKENRERLASENAEFETFTAHRREITAAVNGLTDQPTAALQQQLKECEDTNARVRANAEKKAATAEGGRLRAQYATLTDKVEETRAAQVALLDNADLPLKPHLTVVHGELMYDGLPWDNLATSEQMKVAAAISSRENPNCGFLLADGLETMDVDTLTEFCGWAEGEDLQVIGTRVSVGDECTLIIQAGKVKGDA